TLAPESLAAVTAAFEAAYRALYSRTPLGVAIEALNWRVVVSGPPPDISIDAAVGPGPTTGGGAARKTARRAYFPEAGGYTETPVYDRYRLEAGVTLEGPVIVEERESTTIIGPGA